MKKLFLVVNDVLLNLLLVHLSMVWYLISRWRNWHDLGSIILVWQGWWLMKYIGLSSIGLNDLLQWLVETNNWLHLWWTYCLTYWLDLLGIQWWFLVGTQWFCVWRYHIGNILLGILTMKKFLSLCVFLRIKFKCSNVHCW